MIDNSILAHHMTEEYELQKKLFENQLPMVQHFLESQASLVANALLEKTSVGRFSLPDRVNIQMWQLGQQAEVSIPAALREQKTGHGWVTLTRHGLRDSTLRRLNELESSPDQAIASATSLLRYATATHIISNMLPAGRKVVYRADENEDIACIPVDDGEVESAITQASDAIAESGQPDAGRGTLQSPFTPAARKFFLPQWVAFDLDGRLLPGSEQEAEAQIRSMQQFVQILHGASSLAPYMVACEEYQRKRYGILGQLINQGRALANYKTQIIIQEIRARAKKGSLNRGLSITLNYFNDQDLELCNLRLDVIPAGRILFLPAFVVNAAREKHAQVSQDTRLNSSTRKHLLAQLKALELAFLSKN